MADLSFYESIYQEEQPPAVDNASEKAFYATGASNNPDMNMYQTIKKQLEVSGQSQVYDQIMSPIQEGSEQQYRDMVLLNEELTMEQKVFLLQNPPTVSERDAFREQQVAKFSPENIQLFQNNLITAEDYIDIENAEESTMALLRKDMPISTSQAISDVLWTLAPYVESGHINVYTSELTDHPLWKDFKEHDVFDIATYGTLKKELRDYFNSLPPGDKIEAAKAVYNVARNTKGLPILREDFARGILEGDPEWLRNLEDFAGGMDLASGILGLGVGTIAAIKHFTGKPLGTSRLHTIINSNPDSAKDAIAAGLADTTGLTDEALGVTPEELISGTILPTPVKDLVNNAPSDVVDHLINMRRDSNILYGDANQIGIALPEGDKKLQQQSLFNDMKKVEGVNVSVPNTKFTDTGNSFKVEARYGRANGKNFGTYEAAKEQADMLGVPYTISKKDTKNGIWEKVDKDPKVRGSYAIDIDFDMPYNSNLVTMFGQDSFKLSGNWFLRNIVFDPASRLPKWMSKAGEVAADMTTRMEMNVTKHLQEAFKPLTRKQITKVSNFIETAEDRLIQAGKTHYTFNDLRMEGLTIEEAHSVLAFQEAGRFMYNIDNRIYRRALENKGYKWIVGSKFNGSDRIYGVPVAREEIDLNLIKKAINDRSSNTAVKLNNKMLDSLYDSGGTIVRLERPQHSGTSAYQYAVVTHLDEVKDLPASAMPFKTSMYYPRNYDEYWKVVRTPKNPRINGRNKTPADPDLSEAIEMYSTEKEALAAIKALESESDGKYVYRAHQLAELSAEDRVFQDAMRLHTSGWGYVRSSRSRGEKLKGNGPNGLARIEDPLQALFRGLQASSRRAGMDDITSVIRNKLNEAYGNKFDRAGTPRTNDEVEALGLSSTDELIVKTNVEYLNILERMPPKYRTSMNSAMLGLIDSMHSMGLINVPIARKLKEGLHGIDPINAAKSLAFIKYIQGRPLRQFLLQGSQVWQYAGIAPKYAPKLPIDMHNFLSTAAGIMKPNPEMRELFELWERTGFAESVKKHPYVSKWFNNPFSNPVAHKPYIGLPAWWDQTVLSTLGKGFEGGEMLQLLGGMLTARYRFIQKNGVLDLSNPNHIHQIIADTRAMSGSMNQGGRMGYQTGLLSAATQFASAPHKQALMLLTNRRITNQEKARLAAWNVMLFGQYTLSAGRMLEKIEDLTGIDPEWRNNEYWQDYKNGILEYSFNKMLGEAGDVSFRNISPTEGPATFALDFFYEFFNMEDHWREIFLGPSMHSLSSIGKAYDLINMLTATPSIDTEDALVTAFRAIASSSLAGWSDFEKAQYAHNYGWLTSTRGTKKVESAAAEAIAALFGLSSKREDEMNRLMNKKYDVDKEIRDSAKELHDAVLYYHKLHGDTEEFEMAITGYKAKFIGWSPERMSMLHKEFGKLLKQSSKDQQTSIGKYIFDRWGDPDFNQNYLDEMERLAPDDLRKYMQDMRILSIGGEKR